MQALYRVVHTAPARRGVLYCVPRAVGANDGQVREQDKCGNDGADSLATAAADVHCAPPAIQTPLRKRRELACSIQGMRRHLFQSVLGFNGYNISFLLTISLSILVRVTDSRSNLLRLFRSQGDFHNCSRIQRPTIAQQRH